MTEITTSSSTPAVPGGFSAAPAAGASGPRDLPPMMDSEYETQFLAPPTAEDQLPAPRKSDCGEVAMQRLRHPFAVAADTAPPSA